MRREGRAGERADEQAHSLSLANACNPYCKHTPWCGVTRAAFSPLCSISRQPIWAGTRSDKFTRRSRDHRGRNANNYNTRVLRVLRVLLQTREAKQPPAHTSLLFSKWEANIIPRLTLLLGLFLWYQL
jgi:hypothetical protein